MPTPYDLYVRFLVTKGVDDVNDANRALEELNLPEIDQPTFDAQYTLVTSQVPAGILAQIERKSYSVDFLPWMKILQVEELWHFERVSFLPPPKDDPIRHVCKLVYDLHQDMKLRLTVNALLIKNVPPNDIAQTVNLRYASLFKEDHIRIYEWFFFAPRSMTRGAWRAYLRRVSDLEAVTYSTALTEPLDVLKTNLDLPAKHSTAETLQYLLTRSTVKAKRLMDDDTPEGRRECREWIDVVLKVTDKYEKYRAGDQSDFANSLQMEFDFIDTNFSAPDPEVLKELAAKKAEREKEASANDENGIRKPDESVEAEDESVEALNENPV